MCVYTYMYTTIHDLFSVKSAWGCGSKYKYKVEDRLKINFTQWCCFRGEAVAVFYFVTMGNKESMMSLNWTRERKMFSFHHGAHVWKFRCYFRLLLCDSCSLKKKKWPLGWFESVKVWPSLHIFLLCSSLRSGPLISMLLFIWLKITFSVVVEGRRGQMGLWHLRSKQTLRLHLLSNPVHREAGICEMNQYQLVTGT